MSTTTRTRSELLQLVAACFVAACACGDDGPAAPGRGLGQPPDDPVGVPQPVPIPIDGDLLRAGGAPETDAELLVLGLPGAVARSTEVAVENLRSGAAAQATSTDVGTFSLFLRAAKDDLLRVSAAGNEGSAELTVLSLQLARIAPPPGAAPGVVPVTREADDTVVVRGAHVGGAVIGVNLTRGATVRAAVAGGRFELRLPGAAGDALQVYADEAPLVDPWELSVP